MRIEWDEISEEVQEAEIRRDLFARGWSGPIIDVFQFAFVDGNTVAGKCMAEKVKRRSKEVRLGHIDAKISSCEFVNGVNDITKMCIVGRTSAGDVVDEWFGMCGALKDVIHHTLKDF